MVRLKKLLKKKDHVVYLFETARHSEVPACQWRVDTANNAFTSNGGDALTLDA